MKKLTLLNAQRLLRPNINIQNILRLKNVSFVNPNGISQSCFKNFNKHKKQFEIIHNHYIHLNHIKQNNLHLLVGKTISQHNQSLIKLTNHKLRYITVQQLASAFPLLVPLSSQRTHHQALAMKKILSQRIPDFDPDYPIKFDSILFVDNVIQMWDQSIQIILDLLSTNDGRIAHKIQFEISEGIPLHVPYFKNSLQNGILGVGHFIEAFKIAHELIYKRKIANLRIENIESYISFCKNYVQKINGQIFEKVIIDSSLLNQKQIRSSKLNVIDLNEGDIQSQITN